MNDEELHAPISISHARASSPPATDRRADPCVLVIFGASGDLTSRKLVPALYNLAREKLLPSNFATVGFARRDKSDAAFRDELREAADKFSRSKPVDADVWSTFSSSIEWHRGSFDDAAAYVALGERLRVLDARCGTKGNRLYYFATPPESFPIILEHLSKAGLLCKPEHACAPGSAWTRVIIEKPFGRDLKSAQALNRELSATLDESQIFRIDHYLGKETVQNILVFRFGNSIFEPLWNRKYIDHVQITAAEQIGVEGRGNFYDTTGIVRDFVQNHILEVLSLVAMEPPVSFDANEIRDEKAQVLRSLRPIPAEDVARYVVHGQYDGYRDEPGVDKKSRTPTFAALQLHIDNWRWQGVPFFVRAGKALKSRATEVAIHFQRAPLSLFGGEAACNVLAPNVLTLRIQPDEGIALRFESKVPGDAIDTASVTMDFSYKRAFSVESADAYERLLLAAMRGDATLFLRRDAVEHAWRYVTPMLEAWDADVSAPAAYAQGSEGPREADALLTRAGRTWRPL
ncbi:MAG: glucose-6-phosphate dehydrogenase [Polyangiales bacterium]